MIESGRDKIIVPSDVYEATKEPETSERFGSAVGQVFHGAASDPAVKGLGLKTTPDESPPSVYVPREKFVIFDSRRVSDEGVREIIEFANLEISRAIFGARRS